VIISESLAARLYPRGDAVGRAIWLGEAGDSGARLQIVGVAEDARFGDLHDFNPLQIYLPLFQQPNGLQYALLEICTPKNPMSSVPAVSHEIRKLGHDYVWRAERLSETIDHNLSQERLLASLFTFFGAMAILLACIGLYGLLALMVHQRIREFGLRVALGAIG
jgi:hypothetical protein